MSGDEKTPTSRTAGRKYDLQERTALFGEKILNFVQTLEKNDVNRIVGNQLTRSATSGGANYMEADGAESKKDFRHKISLCKKEAKESTHWLRMIVAANLKRKMECEKLQQEAHELALIFSAILLSKKTSGEDHP